MKKLVLAATVVLALSLAACNTSGPTTVSTQVTPTAAPKANVFTSIQDALSKSLSLRCDYPDVTNKTTVTAYIKNGAVRMSNISMSGKNGNAIMKNNQMWIWSDSDKTGMLIAFNPGQMSQAASSAAQNTQTTNNNAGESVLGNLEKYKQYCKPAVVADSMFIPPTDVTFTDLSKMMQNVNMPKIPVSITPPSGY